MDDRGVRSFGVSPGFTSKALLAFFCDCDLVSPAARLARRDCPSTFLLSIPRLWCISRAIWWGLRRLRPETWTPFGCSSSSPGFYVSLSYFRFKIYEIRSQKQSWIFNLDCKRSWKAKLAQEPLITPINAEKRDTTQRIFFKLTSISFPLMNVWNKK